MPLYDTEASHVLETCLAGKAHILITAKFQDFITKDTQVIINEPYAIYTNAKHNIIIVHPFLMAQWLNWQNLPLL